MKRTLARGSVIGAALAATSATVALASPASAVSVPTPPAPSAVQLAVPTTGKLSVPNADAAKIAKQYGGSVASVLAQQAKLAPIIAALSPSASKVAAQPKLKVTDVADATADECFVAIGQGGPSPDATGKCPVGYKPKYNDSYVYGSAVTPDAMYFGTLTNPVCGAASAYLPKLQPFVTDDLVCEGAGGPNGRALGWGVYGDFAHQVVNRLDVKTNKVTNVTPSDEQAPLLKYSTGLRGGGYKDDVVLMANSTMNDNGTAYRGLEMLAYQASTGKFLGEHLFPQYFNMRNGTMIGGQLYFGARLAGGATGAGGAILKWTGSLDNPFSFEVVAQGLKSEVAYVTEHEGHIVASGWTVIGKSAPENAMAEIYQGPVVPKGGLTAATADASNWKTIMKMSDFEPDPVIARSLNFGDLASYKGKLIFSTYAYAGYGTTNAYTYYGRPADEIGRLNTYVNAERSASVLEMDNVGKTNQKVQLLYGDTTLPVYNTPTKTWQPKPNKLGQVAKYGTSGFGNRFNYYSWMWTQYKGSLYMSTFDATSMIDGVAGPLNSALLELSPTTLALLKPLTQTLHQQLGGADVWRFDDPNRAAVPETLDGFGDKNRHGVRAWAAFPQQNKIYAGMTSWRNLQEGWRVNQLTG